jgi:hypothetical protein
MEAHYPALQLTTLGMLIVTPRPQETVMRLSLFSPFFES